MKFLATIFLFGLFTFTVFPQTTKPKSSTSKSKPSTSKAKPTVSSPKIVAAKSKTTVSKGKVSASNAKASPAKSKTTASKGKVTVPSAKSATSKAKSAAAKPKTTPATGIKRTSKPKAAVTAVGNTDEKVKWGKAVAIANATDRIAALKRFLEDFPNSGRKSEALSLIVTAGFVLGNDKMATGDVPAAAAFYKTAAQDAPKPIPSQLFADVLSKFPANLYFRGARSEAYEIARILESKADSTPVQLLDLASFYLSVENGADAKRVTENAVKLDPNNPTAYQTLGLANRIEFLIEESAAAYSKALSIEPDSLRARRGLAEMKRAMGQSVEAIALYRQILAKDESDLPAQTGLVLSLFDGGSRADAEAEMAKSLDANPGNVILLAGAAYWYAAHNESDRSIGLAQKAVSIDPRFVWSYIALARGYLGKQDPISAEKTLLSARQYGNFPTLEYEIASAKLAAGYYREAAEELAKSFSIKDGVVHTALGGRVSRESKSFIDLVGFERRASIFAPNAADNPKNAAQLAALLAFKQELGSPTPNDEDVVKVTDAFIAGGDKMKLHRQIYAASQLLEKKIALPKVLEIAKSAAANVDAGLDINNPSVAVLANEIYENRSIAAVRGEYVNVPNLPTATLSAILRSQIEEISGWATFQMGDTNEAVIRLKRAVSVAPADSAWWRSSTWRLANALAQAGNDAEALEMYIRSYKSSGPTPIRYAVIEGLYKKINGNTRGLEARIGPNPAPPIGSEFVAQTTEKTNAPVTTPGPPSVVPVEIETPSTVETKKESVPAAVPIATPAVAVDEPKPEPPPLQTPNEVRPTPVPEPSPKPSPIATPAVAMDEPKPEPTPVETPKELRPAPTSEPTPKPSPIATPAGAMDDPKPEPPPLQTPNEVRPTPVPEPSPKPVPIVERIPDVQPKEVSAETKTPERKAELFEPVVITIPPPETGKARPKQDDIVSDSSLKPDEKKAVEKIEPTPSPTATPAAEKKSDDPAVVSGSRPRIVATPPEKQIEIKPCKINVSEEIITLRSGGGDISMIVGLDDDGELEGLAAVSMNPQDISLRQEFIAGVKTRALFVLRSISAKSGDFQVKFEMPCGKREVVVRVR